MGGRTLHHLPQHLAIEPGPGLLSTSSSSSDDPSAASWGQKFKWERVQRDLPGAQTPWCLLDGTI